MYLSPESRTARWARRVIYLTALLGLLALSRPRAVPTPVTHPV